MQSGTTGINLTRVYNPIKQAQDHDPKGIFVRRWLPAMKALPDAWLFEPWKMRQDLMHANGVSNPLDMPEPLVDLALATRDAKEKVHARRKNSDVRIANKAVIDKHASRRSAPRPKKKLAGESIAPEQLGFDF